MEENKTKSDIIKILAGNFSVNINKPQSTDLSLQCPQNDIITNSETSMFYGESGHKSISSTPKEPIKLNKGDTKNNYRTSQFQSWSLNNQNKSLNPLPSNDQNQNASSSESESLSSTSSRQLSLKNSKIESKKDIIIIGATQIFFSVSDQRSDLTIQDLRDFFVEKSSDPRPVNIVF